MIYGNENQQEFLKTLIEKDISPILVVGPEGVGKFSFLNEFLKTKTYENIVFTSTEKNFKIDSARFLISLAKRKSKKRVILINEAHKFQSQSQNSFLKILEDNPSKTTFIFVTEYESKILPTIRSRSVRVKFNLVSPDITKNFLKEKGFSEGDIKIALDFYPFQPGKAYRFLLNKDKIDYFTNLINDLTIDENLKSVNLGEFLEFYILLKRKELLSLITENNNFLKVFFSLKNSLDLYADIDYNLNSTLQILNLVLNS